jgi:hypothetical protein
MFFLLPEIPLDIKNIEKLKDAIISKRVVKISIR